MLKKMLLTRHVKQGKDQDATYLYLQQYLALEMRALLASTAEVLAMRAQFPEAVWPIADP